MTSIILEKNKVEYEIPKKKKKTLKNSSNLICDCQISTCQFPWPSQAKFYQMSKFCNSKNAHH